MMQTKKRLRHIWLGAQETLLNSKITHLKITYLKKKWNLERWNSGKRKRNERQHTSGAFGPRADILGHGGPLGLSEQPARSAIWPQTRQRSKYMYDYKVSNRTLEPKLWCQSFPTIKPRFWTPTAKISLIAISTHQKLWFEPGFRPKRAT